MGQDKSDIVKCLQGLGVDWGDIVSSTTPHSPMAWLSVAYLRLSERDIVGARDAVEKVITLDKSGEINRAALGGFFYSLALAAGRAQQWEFVLSCAQKSRDMGFLQTATQDQKRLLSFELAKALFTCYQFHEALESVNYVLHDEPNHVAANTLLGHCYFQLGDFITAREAYVRVLRLGGDDPNIASMLDEIEYAFPVELEKKSPQNMDPFIRVASGLVFDRWLGVFLEKLPERDRLIFDYEVLSQFASQLPRIMNPKVNSVDLKVPVSPMSKEMKDNLTISIPKNDTNPVHHRFARAVRVVLKRLLAAAAEEPRSNRPFVQERVCFLDAEQLQFIRQGAPVVAITFDPIRPPDYNVRLHLQFANLVIDETGSNEKK